jgi:hypothetical protein
MKDDHPLTSSVPPSDKPAPAARSAGSEPLSLEAAYDLVVCGLLLVGLPFLAQHLQPSLLRWTLPAVLVGGGLCVVWGVLGRRGVRCRGGAMVTLGAVACVMVRQAIHSWVASAGAEPKGRMVASLMAVLVLCCAGMLGTLVWEGKKAIRHG